MQHDESLSVRWKRTGVVCSSSCSFCGSFPWHQTGFWISPLQSSTSPSPYSFFPSSLVSLQYIFSYTFMYFYVNGVLTIHCNSTLFFFLNFLNDSILTFYKGLVNPKMKISPCFTHPQSTLGVYDFLLSDESSHYIKNVPGSSKY